MTESGEEFVRQVHILERLGVRRVHLDIADGMFVSRRTIDGLEQLRRMQTSISFDVHLMVQKPELQCAVWCQIPNAERLLIHVESTHAFGAIHAQTVQHGKILGAVINPETPLAQLEAVFATVELVQFMTVHPGAQGRSFVPTVLDKITEFHAAHPHIPVYVDGGVTPATAPGCVHAGATTLVSGSFVMRASDPARALQELAQSVL